MAFLLQQWRLFALGGAGRRSGARGPAPCFLRGDLRASAVTSDCYYLPLASVCFELIMSYYCGTSGSETPWS